ncbi:MAG: TRAP transporter substrate-binding protein DctP [Burkholderiales bacterium]|nr:TRAP transporter substrate-binding protein DctP [Burkholderiales bacterium]
MKQLLSRRAFGVVAALVLTGGAAVRAAEPIQLDLNNWAPSTHHLATNAFEPWKKLVEERSGGRMKINVHHGAVLGASRAVLNDVRGGVYQIGLMISSYYYDTPLFKLTIGELPFAIDGPTVGAKVMKEFVDRHAGDTFDRLGVVNMGVFVSDPYLLMSSQPVRRLEDMRNKKVRVPGKAWVPIAKEWGAVAVSMQLEDSYTALERGTLEVMQTTPGSALGFSYFEPAPFVTRLNAPTVVGGMIMNKGFHDKLPADLRKLLDEELSPALMRMITLSYERSTQEALGRMRESFAKRGKGEVIELPAAERARFMKPTEPEWTAWVNEANKRGYPGEAMMADFKAMLKKNGLTAPF